MSIAITAWANQLQQVVPVIRVTILYIPMLPLEHSKKTYMLPSVITELVHQMTNPILRKRSRGLETILVHVSFNNFYLVFCTRVLQIENQHVKSLKRLPEARRRADVLALYLTLQYQF
jgi:hypothetical protein